MNIMVIGGNQVAMPGTTQEVDDLLKQLRVVLVQQTDQVTKYKTQQDTQIKVAK